MWKRVLVGAALGTALIGPAAAQRLEFAGALDQLRLPGDAAPVTIRRGGRVSTSLIVPRPALSALKPSPSQPTRTEARPHRPAAPARATDPAGEAIASDGRHPSMRRVAALPARSPAPHREPAAEPLMVGWRLVWPILIAASMVLMVWIGLGSGKPRWSMKVMSRIGVANALLPMAIFAIGAPRGLGDDSGTGLLLEAAVLLGIPIALGWALSGLLPSRPS